MKKVSVNEAVIFHIKTLNVCWENGKKLQGSTFSAAPCTLLRAYNLDFGCFTSSLIQH